jgi:hypothetical protein
MAAGALRFAKGAEGPWKTPAYLCSCCLSQHGITLHKVLVDRIHQSYRLVIGPPACVYTTRWAAQEDGTLSVRS